MNQIIVLPEKLSNSRAKSKLYEEFKYAWDKTSSKEKKDWALDIGVDFGKVMLRRGRGLIISIGNLGRMIFREGKDFTIAVYNKQGTEHTISRKDAVVKSIKSAAKTSNKIINNIITLLKTNPKELHQHYFLVL